MSSDLVGVDAKVMKPSIEANQRDDDSSKSAVAKSRVDRRCSSALASGRVSVDSAGQLKNPLTPRRARRHSVIPAVELLRAHIVRCMKP